MNVDTIREIEIDGRRHQCTPPVRVSDAGRYGWGIRRVAVDCESLPGRPCAVHTMTAAAVAHIAAGGAVRTNGHRYRLPTEPTR